MKTWKSNLEETKQRYINWWNHKGIILNMWEHFQEGVQPHAEITPPAPAKDLSQKWFDPQWRAEYLDWYVAHSSLKADILPVANTHGESASNIGSKSLRKRRHIYLFNTEDLDNDDIIAMVEDSPTYMRDKTTLTKIRTKAALEEEVATEEATDDNGVITF